MENLHQPQQQLFVMFLVGMNLIFLVFLVLHFVDLGNKKQLCLTCCYNFPSLLISFVCLFVISPTAIDDKLINWPGFA